MFRSSPLDQSWTAQIYQADYKTLVVNPPINHLSDAAGAPVTPLPLPLSSLSLRRRKLAGGKPLRWRVWVKGEPLLRRTGRAWPLRLRVWVKGSGSACGLEVSPSGGTQAGRGPSGGACGSGASPSGGAGSPRLLIATHDPGPRVLRESATNHCRSEEEEAREKNRKPHRQKSCCRRAAPLFPIKKSLRLSSTSARSSCPTAASSGPLQPSSLLRGAASSGLPSSCYIPLLCSVFFYLLLVFSFDNNMPCQFVYIALLK